MRNTAIAILGIGALVLTSCGSATVGTPDAAGVADVQTEAAPTVLLITPLPTTPLLTTPLVTMPPTVLPATPLPTLPPTEQPTTLPWPDGYIMTVDMDVERGRLIDGEYVPEFDEDSMRWKMITAVAPDERYGFTALDALAEPGDAGCAEILATASGFFQRNTFDIGLPRIETFELTEGGTDINDALPVLPTVTDLFAAMGISPPTASETGSGPTRRAELDVTAIEGARETLPNLGGIRTNYDEGVIEIIENDAGWITDLTLTASYRSDRNTGAAVSELVEVESYELRLTFAPIHPDYPRFTPATSMLETRGCVPRTAALPGVWKSATVIADGYGVPFDDAVLMVAGDGALSGRIGCRTFTGTSDIGFGGLDNVILDVKGDACDQDDQVPSAVLDVLSANPSVLVDGDGFLFLFGDDEVVVAFV